MPNPKFERLLKNHRKKKGPAKTIQRQKADPGPLTPLSAVKLSTSARRALDWIKKGKFDSLSREELQAIVDKERKPAQASEKKEASNRSFRREIRPLRSKPPSRKILRALDEPSSRVRDSSDQSKYRGEKPVVFTPNKIYEEENWFCCGYCSVATINNKQFVEHKNSAKHQLKVELSTFRDFSECLCGKIFKTANKVHKYRHIKSCDIGKSLLK